MRKQTSEKFKMKVSRYVFLCRSIMGFCQISSHIQNFFTSHFSLKDFSCIVALQEFRFALDQFPPVYFF